MIVVPLDGVCVPAVLWIQVEVSEKGVSEKVVLSTRLSSLDVAGLGLETSALSGRTLVQYAGSLVGRDFRIVIQVAAFVLYDLVPPECYRAWLALSALVPLIWQPIIYNLKNHVVS